MKVILTGDPKTSFSFNPGLVNCYGLAGSAGGTWTDEVIRFMFEVNTEGPG